MADLTMNLGCLTVKNPVTTASGTFGYGKEYHDYYDISRLGSVTVKGIRMEVSDGNRMPRIAEVKSGMLNAIGLQGPGAEHFLHDENYLPFLKKVGATTFVNIWGKTLEEYGEVAAMMETAKDDIAALEINISCPNVKEGGAAFGTDLKLAAAVVREVRKNTTIPLITKLSPNVTKITDFAKAAVDEGSDMLSLINTLGGMAIDIETRRPKLANVCGGLSGPAVKPVAIKMVYEVSKAVSVPIIGMGGIMCAEDAIEFMIAGASMIAVGTANFVDPCAAVKILDGINEYLDRHNIARAADIVGSVQL